MKANPYSAALPLAMGTRGGADNLNPNLVSGVMAVLLFAFAVTVTLRNYRIETSPGKKKLYLLQLIGASVLLLVFIVGVVLLL